MSAQTQIPRKPEFEVPLPCCSSWGHCLDHRGSRGMKIIQPTVIGHFDTKGTRHAIYSIDFQPNGHRLATGGGDCTIKIWDFQRLMASPAQAASTAIATLNSHEKSINIVRWSKNGLLLASGGDDNYILIHRMLGGGGGAGLAEHWMRAHVLHQGHTLNVLDLSWSSAGLLASASVDNKVLIWQPSGPAGGGGGEAMQTPLHVLAGHRSHVKGIAFDPMDKYLLSLSGDNTLLVWDESFKLIQQISMGTAPDSSLFRRMDWAPDAMAACLPGGLKKGKDVASILQRADWSVAVDLVGHSSAISSGRFSPFLYRTPAADGSAEDGMEVIKAYSLCALGDVQGSVSIWTSLAARPAVVLRDAFNAQVSDLAWSSAPHSILAVASISGEVLLLDCSAREVLTAEEVDAHFLEKFGRTLHAHEEVRRPANPLSLMYLPESNGSHVSVPADVTVPPMAAPPSLSAPTAPPIISNGISSTASNSSGAALAAISAPLPAPAPPSAAVAAAPAASPSASAPTSLLPAALLSVPLPVSAPAPISMSAPIPAPVPVVSSSSDTLRMQTVERVNGKKRIRPVLLDPSGTTSTSSSAPFTTSSFSSSAEALPPPKRTAEDVREVAKGTVLHVCVAREDVSYDLLLHTSSGAQDPLSVPIISMHSPGGVSTQSLLRTPDVALQVLRMAKPRALGALARSGGALCALTLTCTSSGATKWRTLIAAEVTCAAACSTGISTGTEGDDDDAGVVLLGAVDGSLTLVDMRSGLKITSLILGGAVAHMHLLPLADTSSVVKALFLTADGHIHLYDLHPTSSSPLHYRGGAELRPLLLSLAHPNNKRVSTQIRITKCYIHAISSKPVVSLHYGSGAGSTSSGVPPAQQAQGQGWAYGVYQWDAGLHAWQKVADSAYLLSNWFRMPPFGAPLPAPLSTSSGVQGGYMDMEQEAAASQVFTRAELMLMARARAATNSEDPLTAIQWSACATLCHAEDRLLCALLTGSPEEVLRMLRDYVTSCCVAEEVRKVAWLVSALLLDEGVQGGGEGGGLRAWCAAQRLRGSGRKVVQEVVLPCVAADSGVASQALVTDIIFAMQQQQQYGAEDG